jgi:protein gp37
MENTKIDWADATWNPVTGCLNDCPYCYARKQAHRFAGAEEKITENIYHKVTADGSLHVLTEPVPRRTKNGKRISSPYPFDFDPTFHRYRLNDLQKWKTPLTIFVGSMCDLFGEWVPDEWIEEVFAACAEAPQHRYLFLTKNTKRYIELAYKGKLPLYKNYWYGVTTTTKESPAFWRSDKEACKTFVSIEPLLEDFGNMGMCVEHGEYADWVIIGAQTGSKNRVIPKREWIENIYNECKKHGLPVFMKESLAHIWGENLIQELPWEATV